MKNAVQLITYVDRLGGGDLKALHALLKDGALKDLFGGVHLLPFFHPIDGADAGFDPIDHLSVDARLGGWADIKALTQSFELMGDVIVNHMSSQSPQFLDYQQRGHNSPYAGLFLRMDTVFPNGATEKDLLGIYRPRPGLPFTPYATANGRELLWTTFTSQQLDIDITHPQGKAYLSSILQRFADSGIRMVRLDAVGYALKKAGSSCFMEPYTFDFIAAFAAEAKALGIEVLVEIHSYFQRQIEIAKKVDWVYDFALPPLVLHALTAHDAVPLKHWIGIRPANSLTVLDTHDGIGIIDIGADAQNRAGAPGLVSPEQLDALVERIHANSEGSSRQATGAAASNLDLYQVNCTFFDALARSPAAYLAARAIQFFLPGIPQVYYVGLLAGENDMDLLAKSRVGRDINRHHYTLAEIEQDARKPVVQSLFALMRLRNRHPAFGGQFTLLPSSDQALAMRWTQGSDWIELQVDLAAPSATVSGSSVDGVPAAWSAA